MRSTLVVLVAALVLLGCGEASEPGAARQTPTSTPTVVEMDAHFAALKQQGAPVRNSPCGNDFWTRDGKDEGELVVRELGQLVTLTWTDDSERVIGSIRSKRVSARMLCALWEENA